ncbi:MAG: hypothetical protein ABIH92_03145 [Nanoarchaeota archaeon]
MGIKVWVIVILFLVVSVGLHLLNSDDASIIEPDTNNEYDYYNASENTSTIDDSSETRETIDNFPNIEELHWPHMPLRYEIVNKHICKEYELNEIKKAFSILQNSTEELVSFVEAIEDIDLEIVCIDLTRQEEMVCKNVTFNYSKTSINWYDEGILDRSTQTLINARTIRITDNETVYEVCYIDESYGRVHGAVLGEGGPNDILGDIILNASVNLYHNLNNARCAYFPTREIHEILHSFGFDHSVDISVLNSLADETYWASPQRYKEIIRELDRLTSDIMSPSINCALQKKLDEKYISCLKYIYSNGIEGNCTGVNFMEVYGDDYDYVYDDGCGDWYLAVNEDSCCPEPGMSIEGDYCV